MTLRVLGLLALAFLLSQGERPPAYAQQPPVRADNGSVAVGGNVSNSTIIIGYPIELHERKLKEREQELRELFQATLGQSEERRKTIERELQGIQSQLGDLQKGYEERVAELKRVAGELEALRGEFPDAKLQEALGALGQGKTKLADALFAEVESREQQAVERAARAAFERGRIASLEVRWQEAHSHFEKADRLVPDHAEYSWWAASMAQAVGDYSTAARRYEAIVNRVRKEQGEDTLDMAIALNDLVLLYEQGRYGEADEQQGWYGKAEEFLKKAPAIYEKVLPAGHPNLAASYSNLALLYEKQGRYGEAGEFFKKALAIYEKVLPAGHPSLAIQYNNLAGVYWKQRRYTEAEALYNKALEILEQKFGPRDSNTVAVSHNLANLFHSQGRPDKADILLKRFGAGAP